MVRKSVGWAELCGWATVRVVEASLKEEDDEHSGTETGLEDAEKIEDSEDEEKPEYTQDTEKTEDVQDAESTKLEIPMPKRETIALPQPVQFPLISTPLRIANMVVEA